MFYETLNEYHHSNSLSVTVNDILAAIEMQKSSKAPVFDGISMEALIHGGNRHGITYCSITFQLLYLPYSYLPTAFMDSVTIPLVKNKQVTLLKLIITQLL